MIDGVCTFVFVLFDLCVEFLVCYLIFIISFCYFILFFKILTISGHKKAILMMYFKKLNFSSQVFLSFEFFGFILFLGLNNYSKPKLEKLDK